ncbi:lysophospholipid acyltransferase family protein [Sphingobacterium arenae]|uniref:Lauroyl/myristoyl acyltransferase n=1 Tax=Sphingobacterium arenae TaxID=1280598 RepID=A0ABR7Y3S6_9SPHI|nr:hypothetical protein [Sphingobacterium arenae]MBD1425946.1 hypothetical protein [Sphingobacterium arenae]
MIMDFLERSTASDNDVATSWLYALFAANMYRFCPQIDTVSYPDIYRRLVTSRYRASDDQLADVLPVKQEVLTSLTSYIQQIKDRPGIVATFHTGSYRLLSRVMYMQGLNVAVVMSREILAEQGEYLFAQHAKMENVGGLQLIDADAGNCLLKMLVALRDGYHIVIYMDGNHGAAPTKGESDNEEVSFFHCNLVVRKGLAVLSHKRNIPIYPILSSLDEAGDTFYKSYPTIFPNKEERLGDYTTRVFGTLYDHLQEVISVKPEMWEGWLYVHTMPGKREQTNKRRRNQSYWPCRVGTRYYMMISPRYTCQEIGKLSFLCMRKWKRLTRQMKS